MTRFFVEFPRFERDHNGFSKNLPRHKHSWEVTFERERAFRESREEYERHRLDYLTEGRQPCGETPDRPQSITRPVVYDDSRRAFHESAHSILARVLGVTVTKASIDPDGRSESFVDIGHASDSAKLLISLAGREGELLGLGDVGDGDASDIRAAGEIAVRMCDGDQLAADRLIARNRSRESSCGVSAGRWRSSQSNWSRSALSVGRKPMN